MLLHMRVYDLVLRLLQRLLRRLVPQHHARGFAAGPRAMNLTMIQTTMLKFRMPLILLEISLVQSNTWIRARGGRPHPGPTLQLRFGKAITPNVHARGHICAAGGAPHFIFALLYFVRGVLFCYFHWTACSSRLAVLSLSLGRLQAFWFLLHRKIKIATGVGGLQAPR